MNAVFGHLGQPVHSIIEHHEALVGEVRTCSCAKFSDFCEQSRFAFDEPSLPAVHADVASPSDAQRFRFMASILSRP